MDAVSSAASVIAIIQLTGSIVKFCGSYIREVTDARKEILILQRAIAGLQRTLQDLQKFLQNNNEKALPTSSRLVNNIADCLSDLRALEARLEPGKGKGLMRKVGLRALKWPLKRTEMEGIAKNIDRYKSLFLLTLQVDQTSLLVGVAQNTDRLNQHIDLGKLEGAMEAVFESFSDRDEAQCLQGTRTQLLQEIMEWATSPSQKSIFWLNGMAGTGKSTISRTVARLLKDNNHLCASFFFKRGEGDRGNAKKFFPTLTRQLILWSSELRSGVQKSLDHDPDIALKSLREQFEGLLLQPLLSLDQFGGQPQTAVMVIDALDECEHGRDIRNIIPLLPCLQKAKSVRLRVFLTSRPELPISLGFSEIGGHEYQDLALHEIPEEVTEHDIHLFLQDGFAKIRHDRNISQDWPGDDVIRRLVKMSVPLFISAATVCRYIKNPMWEPKLRLTELLEDQAKYATRMEKTYLPILTRLLDYQDSDESEQQQILDEFQQIIGVIILLTVPLSINALSLFLDIRADQISNRLDSFRSVLSVPGDRYLPVRTLHLSFRDFLVKSRGKFLVDEPRKHKEIAGHCLRTMRSHLRRNICKLESPGTHRADIDTQTLRRYLPPELDYSCRYWIYHFQQSRISSSDVGQVLLFLQKHLLHWIEAMSLLGLASEVIGMLQLLQIAVDDDDHVAISRLLQDAKRFILKNYQIADEAPLQLYYAGLIFAPQAAVMRREFARELPAEITQMPQVEEKWDAELQALEGHSGPVCSVAFSPDSQLLVSGSHDNTVRLWDTETGMLQQTLKGHSHIVRAVAFSPDGRLLASGSCDNTVCIWDISTGSLQKALSDFCWVLSVTFSPDGRILASGLENDLVQLWDLATGTLQHTLRGHSHSVASVAFSPDGQLLASGSHDSTVQLWDPVTGVLQRTLKGHIYSVTSVTFSPNSLLLASASFDSTVCLWDPTTGALQKKIEGHLFSVQSVAFSPDSSLLVSGSDDKTIRIWDIATGAIQQTLEGHVDRVRSVAFSSNSQLLASGSEDQTVRIWEPAIGAPQRFLRGHSHSIISLAFSPDGQLLASGSYDSTVQLWNTTTGALQQTFKGHLNWVLSVTFSPDNQLLASGSEDKTVRLWEIATGTLQKTIENHPGSVLSVAFSPDRRLLASASQDNIVRLWDLATGMLQRSLKKHSSQVRSLAFSPDGRPLASGSWDRSVCLWDTATGTLRQTWNFEVIVNVFEFSPDGSYLRTSLGGLDKQSGCVIPTTNLPHADLDISENRQWIKLNGKNVLWLPPESRPSCFMINGSRLALGQESGRVSFIEFCT
ncbi:hypothetical protein IFM46972_07340 [Aspergillus udagawae]|uniref:Nephrocystin 3-like N-terminal domain-containing protein n=1 Tax=Aspergillus udagawae TaxID=91492 RepID=A0A8H3P5M2_9EURO|nr:hypothetical protein IFM46972_07340 [Aspergillus udagawae]